MKRIKLLMFSILSIGLAYFAYLKVDRFLQIDRCLDKGSRWNYSENKCECLNKRKINQNKKIILEQKNKK
jgi:hypothetical protein